jgi:hypothetical protein
MILCLFLVKLKNVCSQITIISAGHNRIRIVPSVPEVPMVFNIAALCPSVM